jgi:acyl dehydratase
MMFWEDLQPGQKFGTAEYTMTAEEIIAFAQRYDPQPFHTDPAAAPTSFFGEHVASGWHTASVSMRLMVQGEMQVAGGVVGHVMEELRFPRPVRPGDRLRVVQEVVQKSDLPTRPTHGRLKLRCRTFNQNGKLVQDMTAHLIIQRRTPTASGK